MHLNLRGRVLSFLHLLARSRQAKARAADELSAELADVKTHLEEASTKLAAREADLVRAQATASQNAGFVAEGLRGELDALVASSQHKVSGM